MSNDIKKKVGAATKSRTVRYFNNANVDCKSIERNCKEAVRIMKKEGLTGKMELSFDGEKLVMDVQGDAQTHGLLLGLAVKTHPLFEDVVRTVIKAKDEADKDNADLKNRKSKLDSVLKKMGISKMEFDNEGNEEEQEEQEEREEENEEDEGGEEFERKMKDIMESEGFHKWLENKVKKSLGDIEWLENKVKKSLGDIESLKKKLNL